MSDLPQMSSLGQERSAPQVSLPARKLTALSLILLCALSGCHTPHFEGGTNAGCDCFALSDRGCDTCPPLIGHGLPKPPGNLLGRFHHNIIAEKIAAHKEAKAAPPWPRFHPLPTRPALYPESGSQDSLQPDLYGGFEASE